jgi:energy-coupling factor transport system permease protein
VLPVKKMKSGLFPILFFLLFTLAGNLFFHSGRIIFSHGFLSITDEGVRLAGIRTLRVFSMIFAAKILTTVLSVDRLIHSLEGIMGPLEKIGIPIRDFFSVMGLTLKSFPALMTYLLKTYREEAKNNDVQGFRKRMGHMAAFLMPVFVKSIQSPETFFVSPECADPLEQKR